jgi:hypothetical protein
MYSKIIRYFNIIFAIMLFVSCQDANDDVLLLDNATDNQSIIDHGLDNGLVFPTEIDSLKQTEPYEINTLDDLLIPMQKADSVFKIALKNGNFVYKPSPKSNISRASSSKHIEYERYPLVMGDDSLHQAMFFKSKFSSTVVNLINAKVDKQYRLSTGTTYCCYWYVYYHRVKLDKNQRFGKVASPKCALQPETKSSYIDRGYQKTEKTQNDGTKLVELYSYELYILYKEKNPPTRLDIYYPFVLDSPSQGYEFIYNILTL